MLLPLPQDGILHHSQFQPYCEGYLLVTAKNWIIFIVILYLDMGEVG